MNLLICNDDGIESEGLKTLAVRLSKKHNIIVVAPFENRSAIGHAISIGKQITLVEHKFNNDIKAFSLSGTPADCVKFAIHYFKEFKIDAVVSGINIGSNLGTDIIYSGTLSAALEGVYFGYPAFAVSSTAKKNNNFEACAQYAEEILEAVLLKDKSPVAYNINVPNISNIKGIKLTKLGILQYEVIYTKVGENSYVLSGDAIEHDKNDVDCDVEYNKKGYVTVTPVLFNKSDYFTLENMKRMQITTADGKVIN